MPDTQDPQPPKRVEDERVLEPTNIEMDEYHTRADEYMEEVHERAEAIQESEAGVDVEFSVSNNTIPV